VEAEDVCALAQQAIHQVLQHRRIAAREWNRATMQALPVNDPDASRVVFARVRQEGTQQRLSLAEIESVQVEFLLHRDFAAA
jgi:hypothetical protein